MAALQEELREKIRETNAMLFGILAAYTPPKPISDNPHHYIPNPQ